MAWPAEVEVINPEQPIATLESADAVLDMDIWVSRNRGYRPAEAQEIRQLGDIPIDAIYTPIERVNFVVEHTRVGPMTDFDRLILEILTDGTIEPDDALAQAAQILVEHARIFADFNRKAIDLVINEARNLALKEILPTQADGDRIGLDFDNGVVKVPESFHKAWKALRDGEWLAMTEDPEWGGQGMPRSVA